jgi:hypothetical protein
MDLLVVVDGVTDYAAFREVFDEDGPERAKFSASMLAGPIDGDRVAIVCHGIDMPAMAAFMGSAEFEARTSQVQSGVTLYELSELAPPAH